jgi:membrane protein DedA with SNARE-associated domain
LDRRLSAQIQELQVIVSSMEGFLNYVESLPNHLAYLLLGLSAFVENVFPPIPGDTITAFGAFLVGMGRLDFVGVYLSTTFGSLLGFMALFWLGSYLGRHFFIKKDYRFFKAKDIIKAEEWFRNYGYYIIACNRFLPGLRSVISLAGGISGLNMLRVAVLACLSCAVWNAIWITVGYFLGTNWEAVKTTMSAIMVRYNITIAILFVLVVSIIVIKRKYKR